MVRISHLKVVCATYACNSHCFKYPSILANLKRSGEKCIFSNESKTISAMLFTDSLPTVVRPSDDRVIQASSDKGLLISVRPASGACVRLVDRRGY